MTLDTNENGVNELNETYACVAWSKKDQDVLRGSVLKYQDDGSNLLPPSIFIHLFFLFFLLIWLLPFSFSSFWLLLLLIIVPLFLLLLTPK